MKAPAPYDEAWNALTDGQKELFQRCFDWQYQSQPRPTPEEWLEALREMPGEVPPAPAPQTRQPTPRAAQPVNRAPAVAPTPQPVYQAPAVAPRPRTVYPATLVARPARSPHRQVAPAPAPAPAQAQPPVTSVDGADWLYWALAAAGYGALIPLTLFSQFRPWWWLALILLAAGSLLSPDPPPARTPHHHVTPDHNRRCIAVQHLVSAGIDRSGHGDLALVVMVGNGTGDNFRTAGTRQTTVVRTGSQS